MNRAIEALCQEAIESADGDLHQALRKMAEAAIRAAGHVSGGYVRIGALMAGKVPAAVPPPVLDDPTVT